MPVSVCLDEAKKCASPSDQSHPSRAGAGRASWNLEPVTFAKHLDLCGLWPKSTLLSSELALRACPSEALIAGVGESGLATPSTPKRPCLDAVPVSNVSLARKGKLDPVGHGASMTAPENDV